MVAQSHSADRARSILCRLSGIFTGAISSPTHSVPSLYRYWRWRLDDRRTAHSERRGATSGAWKVSRNSGTVRLAFLSVSLVANCSPTKGRCCRSGKWYRPCNWRCAGWKVQGVMAMDISPEPTADPLDYRMRNIFHAFEKRARRLETVR